jgi:hypothetical protein
MFSEFHHQAPYMFVRPQILMSRDVSDCEILCYDPAIIPMVALLQPSRFIFFLLKRQFDRIWSTVPVQFSSVFNFHQRPVYPSRYDRDHVCLLDRSSGYLDHLPFPDMRDFNKDIADKIHQWAEIPLCPTVMLHCFQECLMNFVVNLLLAESGTICLLQWAENCSITSSN